MLRNLRQRILRKAHLLFILPFLTTKTDSSLPGSVGEGGSPEDEVRAHIRRIANNNKDKPDVQIIIELIDTLKILTDTPNTQLLEDANIALAKINTLQIAPTDQDHLRKRLKELIPQTDKSQPDSNDTSTPTQPEPPPSSPPKQPTW